MIVWSVSSKMQQPQLETLAYSWQQDQHYSSEMSPLTCKPISPARSQPAALLVAMPPAELKRLRSQ